MSEFIYTEQRDQVLLLQIRYEQTLNCLNNEILKEIAGILREFSRDPGLRVVIVTGTRSEEHTSELQSP